MVDGRGAFTKVGKDNLQSFYTYRAKLPRDGATPEKGFNYEAVHLGVKSIEQRLVQLGYDVLIDGILGPKVERAIKKFQTKNGISSSGQLGYNTGPALFRGYIEEVGQSFNFNPAYIYGFMKAESGGDPGAVGYSTPGDRGLFQFNTTLGSVTVEEAHDFEWATEEVFSRFNNALNKYKGKGAELKISCAILQHKSPAAADYWFENEQPLGEVSIDYVSRVKAFALTY